MAEHDVCRRLSSISFILFSFCISLSHSDIVSSTYALDTEYSGANFFNGWDFFTGGDPTGGFVTFYDQASAQLTGLINASSTAPTYIGVDYTNIIPLNGAGRPSVRISTQKSWTHGLFLGDFSHAPGGICGTWPAWWTLGPNWPYTGEIDILEGVNQLTQNAMSLHTNVTCTINSDPTMESGLIQGTNCAYYPQYGANGQGCGFVDPRTSSYGTGFNSINGGVYAMQWTSDYIKVWFFPRSTIPPDITSKNPNPSGWGLPAAYMGSYCPIDSHFQQHKIIFDNTFCGGYAGVASVWNSTQNSCATSTGYSTCNAFVAASPGAFQNAYWSINSVRVYQLVQPGINSTSSPYIASLQPTSSASSVPTSSTAIPSPTASYCPTYNYTVIQASNLQYEIACGANPPGPDLGAPYSNYPVHKFEDCVAGCTYWNMYNGSNSCAGVAYNVNGNACYWKSSISNAPVVAGFNGARLIYYAYPQVTDNPNAAAAATTSTSAFTEIIPTQAHYIPPGSSFSNVSASSASAAQTTFASGGIIGMGGSVAVSRSSASLLSAATASSVTLVLTPPMNTTYATASPTSSSASVITFSSTALSTSSTTPFISSIGTSSSQLAASSIYSSISGISSSNISSTAFSISYFPSNTSSTTSTSLHSSFISPSLTSSSIILMLSQSSPPSITGSSQTSSQIQASFPSAFSAGLSSSSLLVPPPASSFMLPPLPPLTFLVSTGQGEPFGGTGFVTNTLYLPTPEVLTSGNGAVTEIGYSTMQGVLFGGNGDATNVLYSTTQPSLQPQPSSINYFIYAGCERSAQGYASFRLVEDSSAMSIAQCVSDCYGAAYAGIFSTSVSAHPFSESMLMASRSCYCSSNLLATANFTTYPDSNCNIPCPGDPTEVCGGELVLTDRMGKRDNSTSNGMLLTVYNNSMLVSGPSGPRSNTVSLSIVPASTISSSNEFSNPPSSTPQLNTNGGISSRPVGVASPSASQYVVVLPSISTAQSLSRGTSIIGDTMTANSSNDPGSPSQSTEASAVSNLASPSPKISPSTTTLISSVFSSSPTLFLTTLTTIFVDVCDACEHHQTTLSTIVTMLHCGCTASANEEGITVIVPPPTIPMTAVVKSCNCGEGNRPSTTTVTVPCSSAIEAMSASVAAAAAFIPAVKTAAAASLADEFLSFPQLSSANPIGDSPPITNTLASPSAGIVAAPNNRTGTGTTALDDGIETVAVIVPVTTETWTLTSTSETNAPAPAPARPAAGGVTTGTMTPAASGPGADKTSGTAATTAGRLRASIVAAALLAWAILADIAYAVI